jgi:hypothetical protein
MLTLDPSDTPALQAWLAQEQALGARHHRSLGGLGV